MTVPSTNISISAIRTELGSSSGSLKTLSELAGKSAPHAMSEFANYTHSISMTVTTNGLGKYFGKGAKYVSGVMVTQPTTTYMDGSTWGSVTAGSPMSSSGWGKSLTVAAATFMRFQSNNIGGMYFEATSTSSTAPTLTWWNSLTISKSGYTSLVYYRSNATDNYWDSTQKRMFIRWSPPASSYDSYYDICKQSGTTWTFST